MFYDFALTVGKKGSATERVDQEVNLTDGIIHRVEVQFPIGCAGLARCQIYEHAHQIWPTNIDSSFASDGYTIAFDEHYELTEPPHVFRLICWNEDDTYPHTITVRIGILESKTALFFMSVMKGLSKMLKLMGVKV